LLELARHPWQGDRSEVEAVLRATFAATTRDPVEADDLRLGLVERPALEQAIDAFGRGADASRDGGLPVVEAIEEDPDAHGAGPLLEPSPIDWERTGEALPSPAVPPSGGLPAASETGSAPAGVDESALLSDASFDLAEVGATVAEQSWRRLARSLSHEIRNPLVSIRTFAELLPEHYEDETFRQRFAELVGRDVAHISDVVSRLHSVAENDAVEAEPVDVSAMIEELLEERRERIEQGRLLVLRELERESPLAWAEEQALRVALAGLLDRALDSLPERGDLFVATRHVERGNDAESHLRILLRHQSRELAARGATDIEELSPATNVLEYVLADTVARASGGSLTIDSSDAQETLILVDLRTPT
ncbi:MAG: histidine kinase dimerization/phospho-acceptor domain-containing protein, partial [Myxococcota bacterium]